MKAKLLHIARQLLAWDDNFKTVPTFDNINKLVQFGTGMGNLLKTLVNQVYKDVGQQVKRVDSGLKNAYIGSDTLIHGLPSQHVKALQSDIAKMNGKILAMSTHEATGYKGVQAAKLGPTLAILPTSEATLTLYKSAKTALRAGLTALEEVEEAETPKTSAALTTAAHDQALLKKLETEVLPWLANQKVDADGKKTIFPASDLRNKGIQLAHILVTHTRESITDDLIASYKAANQVSLRHLLEAQMLMLAIQFMELQELRLEQKARQFIQSVQTQMRNDKKEEAAPEKKEEAK